MEPLVSIVLPIYNQEIYLDKAMISIMNQTYKNIEIIAVNDGSVDKSRDILKGYEKIDKRIKVIDKENGGLVDAVCAGIKHVTGDYVCFLDPDDYVGDNFILTFLRNIGEADFVAMGFFYDSNGELTESQLSANREYTEEDIKKLREEFLYEKGTIGVSRRFYISRWNKMYSVHCVRKSLEEYEQSKNISLGEDSIFTYLILCHCKSGKTLKETNSYYYNIKSQTSMMSNGAYHKHLEKSKSVSIRFEDLLNAHGGNTEQALFLYYFLIEAVFQRVKKEKQIDIFDDLYVKLHHDKRYQKSLNLLIKGVPIKEKTKLCFRQFISSPYIYRMINSINNLHP
jgi:glycosyltransferase involved in cell wall biosynthesis